MWDKKSRYLLAANSTKTAFYHSLLHPTWLIPPFEGKVKILKIITFNLSQCIHNQVFKSLINVFYTSIVILYSPVREIHSFY